jgi:hypothetical protein
MHRAKKPRDHCMYDAWPPSTLGSCVFVPASIDFDPCQCRLRHGPPPSDHGAPRGAQAAVGAAQCSRMCSRIPLTHSRADPGAHQASERKRAPSLVEARKLTQAERLAEAQFTEEENRRSLDEFMKREAQRKVTAPVRKQLRRTCACMANMCVGADSHERTHSISGPRIVHSSCTVGTGADRHAVSTVSVVDIPDWTRVILPASGVQSCAVANVLYERNAHRRRWHVATGSGPRTAALCCHWLACPLPGSSVRTTLCKCAGISGSPNALPTSSCHHRS